jgi:hypothetical protein
MVHWQQIWRLGIAPQLSAAAIRSLRRGLSTNDRRLVQGRTSNPPALLGLEDAEVEAACAIGYAGWQGEGHDTVGSLNAYFEHICSAADTALGEPCASRHFLDWFDATPREVMRRALAAEIEQHMAKPAAAA